MLMETMWPVDSLLGRFVLFLMQTSGQLTQPSDTDTKPGSSTNEPVTFGLPQP